MIDVAQHHFCQHLARTHRNDAQLSVTYLVRVSLRQSGQPAVRPSGRAHDLVSQLTRSTMRTVIARSSGLLATFALVLLSACGGR